MREDTFATNAATAEQASAPSAVYEGSNARSAAVLWQEFAHKRREMAQHAHWRSRRTGWRAVITVQVEAHSAGGAARGVGVMSACAAIEIRRGVDRPVKQRSERDQKQALGGPRAVHELQRAPASALEKVRLQHLERRGQGCGEHGDG